jgi:hypothetical protein
VSPPTAKKLVGLLGPQLGQSQQHVRNSEEFVRTLDTHRVNLEDILNSFDAITLFTRNPPKDALSLLNRYFYEDSMRIFRHVLTPSFLCFNGQFYEQIDGVAMGSSLSPVMANFYPKTFKKKKRNNRIQIAVD